MLSRIRIDVDDEEGADVVGDVAAAERQRDHPRILSSEAATAAAKAARAPSRSSASRPASVLPPGEATALRTSAGWRTPQQLGGPRGRLDRPAPGPARGRGRRRRRRRRSPRPPAPGRRARSPSPRSPRRSPRRRSRPRARAARASPAPPAPASPATQRTPLRTSTADVRHHPQDSGARETPPAAARAATAARIETTSCAAPSSGATSLELRRLDREHDEVGARGDLLVGDAPRPRAPRPAPRPAGAGVGEQHRSNSPAQPRAIAAAMLPDPTKPTIMRQEPSRASEGGRECRPTSPAASVDAGV